jgi:uncharacterized protein DUF4145
VIPYTAPEQGLTAFNCPSCEAFAKQEWFPAYWGRAMSQSVPFWTLARCGHCGDFSFWVDARLVFPEASSAPPPNPDLPAAILPDYKEASGIVGRSPRGAAALLRLCIQKLCKELGLSGKNINEDIGKLVRRGLSPQIQQALDVVRVIGNNAVHPGELDLRDDQATALKLFSLVNLIGYAMITHPKEISELYAGLPEAAKAGIEKRDKPSR